MNPYEDWLYTFNEIQSLTKAKYDNINDLHHFEIGGRTVPQTIHNQYIDDFNNSIELPLEIIPITNIEYEIRENEKKREILIISEQYIGDLIKQVKELS